MLQFREVERLSRKGYGCCRPEWFRERKGARSARHTKTASSITTAWGAAAGVPPRKIPRLTAAGLGCPWGKNDRWEGRLLEVRGDLSRSY